MPTYEYKRDDGTTFDIIQKMSDNPLTICPTTGQKVRRIVSGGGGVVYKGEGWYVTDYKNGGKKDAQEKAPTEKTPEASEHISSSSPKEPAKKDSSD